MWKWMAGVASGVIVGVTVWWLTTGVLNPNPEDEDRADILVCLQEFSYGVRHVTQSGDLAPEGSARFRLVNVGNLEATATKVALNPVGIIPDGRQGGLATFEIPVDTIVPARGAVSMGPVEFVSNVVVAPEHWFDEPRHVNTWASWPGRSSGTALQCAELLGAWSCGNLDRDTGVLVFSNVCG